MTSETDTVSLSGFLAAFSASTRDDVDQREEPDDDHRSNGDDGDGGHAPMLSLWSIRVHRRQPDQ
jgi:hypothetical protein